jgi:DNA invertase Pin-like site-specific DNA recombinase
MPLILASIAQNRTNPCCPPYNGKVKKRKLSDDQISDIKVKLGQGVPKSRVAKEFGITRETLYKYLNKTPVAPGVAEQQS